MIPAGRYVGRAMAWDLGSSTRGSDYICLRFEIMEGPEAGRSIRWNGYCTEKAIDRTMRTLRICGWKSDNIENLEGVQDNLVELVIDHRVSQDGKPFAEIKWVNSLNAPLKLERPMDEGQRSMFVAKMKMYARQYPLVPGPPAREHDRAITQEQPAQREPGSDDEPPPHTDADAPPPSDEGVL